MGLTLKNTFFIAILQWCSMFSILFSCTEMVALIAGGNGLAQMEAYSPDGRCSQDLGNVPSEVNYFVPEIGYINGKITLCSRYTNTAYYKTLGCSSYNSATSAWNAITIIPSNHTYAPGT